MNKKPKKEQDIKKTDIRRIIKEGIPYVFNKDYTDEELKHMIYIVRRFDGETDEDKLEKSLIDFVIAESMELTLDELKEEYKDIAEKYKEEYKTLKEIKTKEGLGSKAYLTQRELCSKIKTKCNKREMQLKIKPWTECDGHIMVKFNNNNNCGCIKCGYPYLDCKIDEDLSKIYSNSSYMCKGIKNNNPNLYLYGFIYDFEYIRGLCENIMQSSSDITNEDLIDKLKEILNNKTIIYKRGK